MTAILCQWFALCIRAATTTREHPVLGAVPICSECDAKIRRLEEGAKVKIICKLAARGWGATVSVDDMKASADWRYQEPEVR